MNDPGSVSSSKLRLRIGGVDLSPGVTSGSITERINEFPVGEMTVENSVLRNGVEFRGEVEVEAQGDGPRSERIRIFTGQVDEARPGRDVTSLRLVGGMPELREQKVGGLSTDGVPTVELLWAILRASGMPETRIQIEDFEPGPAEPFEVVIPVVGLQVDRPFVINGVSFVATPSISRLIDGLELEELRSQFVEATSHARAVVFDRTLYAAERRGVERIRHAAARVLVRAQYSWAITPGGLPRSYRREWTRGRIELGDIALVLGLATGRRWLRAMTDRHMRPDLSDEQIVPLDGLGEEDVPLQLQEASLAWSRILDASDDVEAVAALWDALEFYASGVRVDPLIPTGVAKEIRRRALEGLSGDVRTRVADVLSNLTDPPLMIRLMAAAEADGAPLVDGDLECLRALRRFRNDFIHGRNRGEIERPVVRQGTAIVNRLLAHRYYRIG